MRDHDICVTALYNLVERKKRVSPWELKEASECLYISSKVVGIKNTNVWYIDENGKRVELLGEQLPELVRAVAGYIVRLLNRWTDESTGRLENHLGLSAPIHMILSTTKLAYKYDIASLPCVSVLGIEDILLAE